MLSHLLGWRNDMRDNLNCTYAHQQYNSIPFFCCYHILRLDSSTSVSKTTETVSSYYCCLKSHSSYKLNENAWLFSVNPTNRFWNLCLFCVFTFLISLSLSLCYFFIVVQAWRFASDSCWAHGTSISQFNWFSAEGIDTGHTNRWQR